MISESSARNTETGSPKRAIYLTADYPFYLRGSHKTRDAQLIKLLMDRMSVELIWHTDHAAKLDSTHFPPQLPEGLQMTKVIRPDPPLWSKALSSISQNQDRSFNPEIADILIKWAKNT